MGLSVDAKIAEQELPQQRVPIEKVTESSSQPGRSPAPLLIRGWQEDGVDPLKRGHRNKLLDAPKNICSLSCWDQFNHIRPMDYVVSVIVTCKADLMQYMLPIGHCKHHFGPAVQFVSRQRNVRIREIGRVFGPSIVLDQKPMTIHRGPHQIFALRKVRSVHDEIKRHIGRHFLSEVILSNCRTNE